MNYETEKDANIRKTNPNGTGYGRIAYNKATENEKRIAASEKREDLDEIIELSETETITALFGDVLQKGIKFESGGDKVTFAFSATFGDVSDGSATDNAADNATGAGDSPATDDSAAGGTNSVTAEIYLNGEKICEKGDGDFPLTCNAKTRNGENVVYAVVGGATANMTVTLTVTGRVKKTKQKERIYYLGSDYFAVSRGDVLSVYKYADGQFSTKFNLCGLIASSASFTPKDSSLYVSGKRFSGTRFIYKINPTTGETTLMDDAIDYSYGALICNVKFRFYFIQGGCMRMASLSSNKVTVTLSKTQHITEVYASVYEGGGNLILKDIYGNLMARRTASGILTNTITALGKVTAPELRYTDQNAVLFRNGDKDGAKTCVAIKSGSRLLPGKIVYDRSPVAESETLAVGLENGQPVVIQVFQQ